MSTVKNYDQSVNKNTKLTFEDYTDDVAYELKRRFNLTPKEIDEVIEWYRVI